MKMSPKKLRKQARIHLIVGLALSLLAAFMVVYCAYGAVINFNRGELWWALALSSLGVWNGINTIGLYKSSFAQRDAAYSLADLIEDMD